jgi:hypothetical protein
MASDNSPGPYGKQLAALGSGLLANPPGGQTTLVVEGVAVPTATLAAEVKGYDAIWATVESTGLAHTLAVQARTKAAPTVEPRVAKIMAAVKGMLGPTNPSLEPLYGIVPDKDPKPLTTEKKAAKNAKALATRKARGTLGKKQKAAIKGVVPTPAPAPAPTGAPVAPAIPALPAVKTGS